MGEMADQIINGEICEFCNMHFKEPHYHPVCCSRCWKPLDKEAKEIHQRAIKKLEY